MPLETVRPDSSLLSQAISWVPDSKNPVASGLTFCPTILYT